MNAKHLFIKIISVFAIIYLSACSSGTVIQNNWKSQEIIVDGNYSEWKNSLKLLPDQKISLAFSNDDKFLYMCLVTEDRARVVQMTRSGFITWFIPESGSENTFGIKYPLPNKNMPREQMQQKMPEMNQQGNGPGGGIGNMINDMLEKQNEIQIVNADKYSLSLLPTENKDGIKAKLGYMEEKFVYELQVPLAVAHHEDYSFLVAALPGQELQIKFETEQAEAQPGGRNNGGMMPSGGGESGGGGQQRGGGMGGMRPGAGGGPGGGNMQRMQMSSPLNYSIDIKLAEKK